MNWLPGFYAVHWAWLFLLLVPLILFYFLKLKRPRLEIPSLALWRSVINDRRVNSPFQKFKRSLLLLLQILLLVCLVLAVMQPFLPSGAERAEYVPILIDTSASMAALDGPGGQSRLEAARERVRRIVDDMLPDQRITLIAVHSTARRLTDFTNNKRVLHDALDKLEVTQVPSKLEDGLRMTQALSRTVALDEVVMFTDGNVPPQIDFELPFDVNYQLLAAGGTNAGITALNARRAGADSWDVFVRVEASAGGTASGDLILLQDGMAAGEETVVLDPGGSERLTFRVDAESAVRLELRLEPSGFDALEADNVAWLDLPAPRPLVTYCPLELDSYRHALAGHKESVALFPDAEEEGDVSAYDLLIADRAENLPADALVTVHVGVIPKDLQSLVSVRTGLAEVVDWKRSEPLLQHVNLKDVQVADEPTVAADVRDEDFEQRGYEIVAHARTGPLILKRSDGQRLSYYLLFHTDRSTLPYRVGFPILVTNAVQIAMAQAELSDIRAAPTGVLPARTLRPEEEYRVTGPGGETLAARTNAEGVLFGIPAPRVGEYLVNGPSGAAAAIGVSLVAPQETSLAQAERLEFREISVAAASERLKTDRPLWPAFAMAGLGLLLAEWWYFQRGPGGLPA